MAISPVGSGIISGEGKSEGRRSISFIASCNALAHFKYNTEYLIDFFNVPWSSYSIS